MNAIELKFKEDVKEHYKAMLSKYMVEAQWKYCQEAYEAASHSLALAQEYCKRLQDLEKGDK